MSAIRPLTFASDPSRDMPASKSGRADGAASALQSLRTELARLERLGLEPALARCRQQLRYWEFLAALFSIDPDAAPARRRREEPRWRIARAR